VRKVENLFFRFPFAKNCWNAIGVAMPTCLKPDRATKRIKRSLNMPFAMEDIIIMCWSIWSECSGWIFKNENIAHLFLREN
jgi:hypothetical protein